MAQGVDALADFGAGWAGWGGIRFCCLALFQQAIDATMSSSNTLVMLRTILSQVTPNTLLMLPSFVSQLTSNKLLTLRSILSQLTSNTLLIQDAALLSFSSNFQ